MCQGEDKPGELVVPIICIQGELLLLCCMNCLNAFPMVAGGSDEVVMER